MKIKNLFCSMLLICLALLLCCGATVPALQFQAQAKQVMTANNNDGKLKGDDLFNENGVYNFRKDDLIAAVESGKVFNFFGFDWRVVFVNEDQNVATFWMADPYTNSIFNKTSSSKNGVALDGTNIWANGYSNTTWESGEDTIMLGCSEINKFLQNESDRIINDKAFAKYKDKVVKGGVIGTNEVKERHTIPVLAYSESSLEDITPRDTATNELTAKYGLGTDSVLWLPSIAELVSNWALHEDILQWIDTTNNNGYAWLRTPDLEKNSAYALCVCASREYSTGTIVDYFTRKHIGETAGVRPAIHMNIKDIDTVISTESESAWFNEDWMKVLFIGVCVLGIIGIGFVTLAVIVKSRQKNA